MCFYALILSLLLLSRSNSLPITNELKIVNEKLPGNEEFHFNVPSGNVQAGDQLSNSTPAANDPESRSTTIFPMQGEREVTSQATMRRKLHGPVVNQQNHTNRTEEESQNGGRRSNPKLLGDKDEDPHRNLEATDGILVDLMPRESNAEGETPSAYQTRHSTVDEDCRTKNENKRDEEENDSSSSEEDEEEEEEEDDQEDEIEHFNESDTLDFPEEVGKLDNATKNNLKLIITGITVEGSIPSDSLLICNGIPLAAAMELLKENTNAPIYQIGSRGPKTTITDSKVSDCPTIIQLDCGADYAVYLGVVSAICLLLLVIQSKSYIKLCKNKICYHLSAIVQRAKTLNVTTVRKFDHPDLPGTWHQRLADT